MPNPEVLEAIIHQQAILLISTALSNFAPSWEAHALHVCTSSNGTLLHLHVCAAGLESE